MKILFCGISVPEKIEYQVEHISAAGNRFQNNMIQTLRAMGHEVTILSYIAMQIPKDMSGVLSNTKQQIYVLRNNGGIKATWKAIKECQKTVKNLLLEHDIVIAYNVFYSFLYLPFISKKYKKRSILILADYSGKECYSSLLGKLYATCQRYAMRKYDTVVGLSSNIAGALKKCQKFILMEGGISQEFYDKFAYKEKEENTSISFMYSGLLSKVTGVDILLEAMKSFENENVELWISGKGDLEENVKLAAQSDNRIRFYGHMEYEDYMKKLQNADILINPRNMSLPENVNNFPSKIMDYLATGKPVISSKFVGWEKFRQEIWFYEDDLTEGMKLAYAKMEQQTIDGRIIFQCNRQRAKEYLWMEQLKKILK